MFNKWQDSGLSSNYNRIANEVSVQSKNQLGWGSILWIKVWERVLNPIHVPMFDFWSIVYKP